MTVSYFYFHSAYKHFSFYKGLVFAIFDVAILTHCFVLFREYFNSLFSCVSVSATFPLTIKYIVGLQVFEWILNFFNFIIFLMHGRKTFTSWDIKTLQIYLFVCLFFIFNQSNKIISKDKLSSLLWIVFLFSGKNPIHFLTFLRWCLNHVADLMWAHVTPFTPFEQGVYRYLCYD